ncbi:MULTISPECIES: 6-hydroxymethylpterin diphosphokinase MptE-like protein [Sporomusa]|uniref:motility associated factor glycosyltransferase family protein n=1 Tax=Sporomusa TaxID=2375 RepID=UPI003159378C
MNLFEDNFAVITKRNMPDFIAEIEPGEAPFYYVGTDEDGTKIFCRNDDKPFILESTIDETNLPNSDIKQLVFLFGVASLHEIQKVAQTAHKESLIVIIEPNPYFLQHAMFYENFELLNNVNYIIVTEKPDKLTDLFKLLFSSKFFYLVKNVTFYLNSYYRKYDSGSIKEYILEIGTAIKNRYFSIGNSIHDSLIGLINNLNNIKALSENVDVAKLKDAFVGIPAFVVAAGPSLDKNIGKLKEAQGKGIIIAVDTIVQKLLQNGITPDFVCTVERGAIVWEYFYENQDFPPNMHLVSSLVADPRIVEKFKHRAVLPLRSSVREYFWLGEKLGASLNHYMWMGASCAHLAVGLALHVGASPIVMVGQDLAYGEKGTHADGTVYDKKPINEETEVLTVPGYYGGLVKTRKIWLEFKQIFENMFRTTDRMIINATEGGAKIAGTSQQSLTNVIAEYCTKEFSVLEIMKGVPVNTIDWDEVERKIRDYLKDLEELRKNVSSHLDILRLYSKEWTDSMPEKKVQKLYETMKKTDLYYKLINTDQLLYHNIQGPMAILVQKFHAIAETDSLESLKQNLLVQIELCEMLENTSWLIIQVIEENFPWNNTR